MQLVANILESTAPSLKNMYNLCEEKYILLQSALTNNSFIIIWISKKISVSSFSFIFVEV